MKIIKKTAIDCRGFSAIGMAFILLLLGSVLMVSLSQFLLTKKRNAVNEKIHYREVNLAISSIRWATTLKWNQPNDIWQCRSHETFNLMACIKQSKLSTGDYVIIQGKAGKKLKRYHLANYQNNNISVRKGHWLDYCPENQGSHCD